MKEESDTLFTMLGEELTKIKYKKLWLICLNPGYIFQRIFNFKPKSLTLTSDKFLWTDSIEEELGCKFHIKTQKQEPCLTNDDSLWQIIDKTMFNSEITHGYIRKKDNELMFYRSVSHNHWNPQGLSFSFNNFLLLI